MRAIGMAGFWACCLNVTGIGLCALSATGSAQAKEVSVQSPNGRVGFVLNAGKGELTFQVTWDGRPVLDKSPLGLVLEGGVEFGPGLEIAKQKITKVDESYEPVWGKAEVVRNHYNLLKATLGGAKDKPGMDLYVRAYDEGIAFRYGVNVADGTDFINIENELTGYHFLTDANAWVQEAGGFNSAYENSHQVLPVSKIDKRLVSLPLLLEREGGPWMVLTEANLDKYAGQYIVSSTGEDLHLKTRLSPLKKGEELAVHTEVPMVTPWRVVMVADHPGRFIESSLLFNCNEPSKIKDTSWIQPGKCMWDWWNDRMVSGVDFKGGINTETFLHYADFAAQMGFEYILIDDGWSVGTIQAPIPELDLPRVIEYCKAKDLKVMLWVSHGRCDSEMKDAFPLYEKWGISGVKIDFMNSDNQTMVDFYHRAIALAAKHKLLVDFHGAYKPTGEGRTWPNWITQEGVKGEEHSKWSDGVTPSHNVMIPFTRMVAGPMDYTPGGFDNWNTKEFKQRGTAPRVQGTRGHNLAKYVIYDSPVQMCVDYPANYRGQPGQDFLREVPTVWSRTIVIDGYPGRSITMARRHGDAWYVGVMQGDVPAATVEVSLDFLGEGEFQARVWEDGDRAHVVATQLGVFEETVTRNSTLKLNVATGGGAVARIAPAGWSSPNATWLRHLVGIKWRKGTSQDDKNLVLAKIRDFPSQIPEILYAEYGNDISGRNMNRGFEENMILTFRGQPALDRYLEHPVHQEFVEFSKPFIEEFLVIDWNTPAEMK